jgi:hypothetical protein
MDHSDISNTVDRTCAFRVLGAATGDVILFRFLRLIREKDTEKIGYKSF